MKGTAGGAGRDVATAPYSGSLLGGKNLSSAGEWVAPGDGLVCDRGGPDHPPGRPPVQTCCRVRSGTLGGEL